jgi:hypothetical protein
MAPPITREESYASTTSIETAVEPRRREHLTVNDHVEEPPSPAGSDRLSRHVRFRSKSDVYEDDDDPAQSSGPKLRRVPSYTMELRPEAAATSPLRPKASVPWTRIFPFAVVALLFMAVLHNSPLVGKAGVAVLGSRAGVIRPAGRDLKTLKRALDEEALSKGKEGLRPSKRQGTPGHDTTTNYCVRWAHQSALVNGTIYIYGGQASYEPKQVDDTWNNDFLSIDVTKTWQISSPTINGLSQPSGPPAVSLGYLWNSFQSLYLYGGEFSWKPVTSPVPYSLWEYSIGQSKWIEHSSPRTLPGNNSDGGGNPVQEAAEGAGVSIPGLGRGYYFGGHLDGYTTAGWSQSVPRIYLKSMIEYTMPGFPNNGIQTLQGGQPAGNDGAWRNITQGGIQAMAGFPERADGKCPHHILHNLC